MLETVTWTSYGTSVDWTVLVSQVVWGHGHGMEYSLSVRKRPAWARVAVDEMELMWREWVGETWAVEVECGERAFGVGDFRFLHGYVPLGLADMNAVSWGIYCLNLDMERRAASVSGD